MSVDTLNAEALRVARVSRGLSQVELADAAGVSQGLISKAEHALIKVAGPHAAAIARALDYPITLLAHPLPSTASTCVFHRKRKTMPLRQLQQLEANVAVRRLNVARLLDQLELESPDGRRFHQMDIDIFGSADAVANELRRVWRVPEGPIHNLTELLESAGAIVVYMDFGSRKLFGMSCWATEDHPLFIINSQLSPEDARFTLAHETGHLLMHEHPSTSDIEQEADDFAGEFLAPRRLIRPSLHGLSFEKLPILKEHWRLPMKAIIKRAERIGAINRNASVRLYKQFSARGYNSREPSPVATEPATLMQRVVRFYMDEHEYSLEDVAGAARLYSDELCAAFDLDRPKHHNTNVVNLHSERKQ